MRALEDGFAEESARELSVEREGQGHAMGRVGGRGGGEEEPPRRLWAVWDVTGTQVPSGGAACLFSVCQVSFQAFRPFWSCPALPLTFGSVAVMAHGCLLLRFLISPALSAF